MVATTTPTELQERLDSAADDDLSIVDIRDPSSYADGHIEGAVNVQPHQLSTATLDAEWAQAEEVVVACYHGKSSQRVAMLLDQHLDADVASLDGGFEGWDGPVADGQSDTTSGSSSSQAAEGPGPSDAPF